MAFALQLASLTRELIEASAPSLCQTQTRRLDELSDAVLRKLRSHTFLQTNHFEVEKALLGLDERFRVNNRDDLADALGQALAALKTHPARWHPEILHLFLELSDQPTFKSRLQDLELIRTDTAPATTTLRWEDIAREDGWDQDHENIWRCIDYSDDDSGDQVFEQTSAGDSDATSIVAEEEQGLQAARAYVVQPQDPLTLEQVQASQRWRTGPTTSEEPWRQTKKVAVSEVQVIRDVLFMLQGLDSTLFSPAGVAMPSFQLENMEREPFRAIMQLFSDHGTHLQRLRQFVGDRQDVPHLQAFQDCISDRLRQLYARVSELQTQLAAPTSDVVVSLVRTKTELMAWLEPLYSLSEMVSRIESEPQPTPFRYLELVFEASCLAQLSGQSGLFEFFARIFAECFRVYLRPIRLWMDEGKLLSASDLFFVAEASSHTPPGKTWQDRYYLRKTPDGALHAPSFLRTAAGNIYNAGKNVVVLKLLGKHEAAITSKQRVEPPLDYDAICPAGQELVPFSELFDVAFDRWIQSKYRATSTILRTCLFQDWSLLSTLGTLQEVYLMSNGANATALTNDIFSKLDELRDDWSDRYSLTAAAQDSFASIADPSRLAVVVEAGSAQQALVSGPVTARDSVRSVLGGIRVDYRVPWPLQMVLTAGSFEHYQSLFTILLQFKRAAYALHKPKMLDNYWTDHEDWNARAVFYSIRIKLLWFCTTVQTYLSTLVLAPLTAQLEQDVGSATDMDELIAAHDAALKAMADQACLGSRLTPIRECMLDVLDLALKLERMDRSRKDAPEQEEDGDDDDDDDDDDDGKEAEDRLPYEERLRDMKREADSQVRFIWSGLRGVARAVSGANAVKWDMLADMLQVGHVDGETKNGREGRGHERLVYRVVKE
ncbi:hypothetical protein E4U42_004446 [Claviceps africana]|uniref:Spindle pole body component n=1 Tax=Claviceps africana TaxID=83212 RepID=A0A8K0J800_9HYPO|nr:hypothetical protein E4U42_004446 [Claviceps africana]